jgi:hypothetical protein
VGGQDMLVGEGTGQNCILAQNGDYVTLAYRMEPLLKDLLKGSGQSWQHIIRNGINGVGHHTPASEEKSVIDFWNRFGQDISHARNCDHISQR